MGCRSSVFTIYATYNEVSPVKYVFYFDIGTFLSVCAVPNMVVCCSSLISCLPGMLLRYCPSNFEMDPVASIISGCCCYYYNYYSHFHHHHHHGLQIKTFDDLQHNSTLKTCYYLEIFAFKGLNIFLLIPAHLALVSTTCTRNWTFLSTNVSF